MSDEQTLFRGSSSPLINLGTFTLCGLVLVGCVIGGFLAPPPFGFVALGVAVLALLFMLMKWLFVKVRVYEVTTERIRITNGLLTRRTDELELYRVKDATLIEPFLLRLFSVGDIDITTHDVSTPVIRMEAVKGARELREELRKSVEACRDRKRVRLAELE